MECCHRYMVNAAYVCYAFPSNLAKMTECSVTHTKYTHALSNANNIAEMC